MNRADEIMLERSLTQRGDRAYYKDFEIILRKSICEDCDTYYAIKKNGKLIGVCFSMKALIMNIKEKE